MLSPAPLRTLASDDADALSRLVRLLRFRTHIFFSGRLCGDAGYEHRNIPAQFHFVLEGRLVVHDLGTAQTREIEAPGLIAFPTANPHRIVAGSQFGWEPQSLPFETVHEMFWQRVAELGLWTQPRPQQACHHRQRPSPHAHPPHPLALHLHRPRLHY